ncbi:MAG: carboxypeptidase-like regulatory domain-containing protein [Chitinophagaceae bacterium]|nr:carboxypeptidase-like regulatory domain-containing protein [Chitinophagaceae bacterium]
MLKCGFILALSLVCFLSSFSQNRTALLTGTVVDENDRPLSKVSVTILGRQSGSITSDSGTFSLRTPAGRAFAVLFSYTGYRAQQKNFLLNENEKENVIIKLVYAHGELEAVTVTGNEQRTQAGLITLNPKNAINIPSPTGGIESLIKVFVGSNNELTSQYSVRGGNYDENLIYVNDFEVFRPYLVRSGQQEGLSFINPELVRNVNFYNGGFQAKYGDKMSSVLDIQYKRPKKFAGSAYAGLLEQGFHLEGVSKNNRFTFLAGVRNRSNRNLLSSQETKGNYVPSSSDIQALLTYDVGNRSSIELLANFSRTKFALAPESSQLTSSVFSPFFSANLGLDIFFEGREKDSYNTSMIGLSYLHQPSSKVKLKWMVSRFGNDEREGIDITGAYLFGEREFDKSKADFGLITNPLGAGLYQTYARNKLNISVWNFTHKGSWDKSNHYIQWGQSVERQSIDDKLHEWEYLDSAGYNLPYNPSGLILNGFTSSKANIDILRLSGYVQDNFVISENAGVTMQGGIRYNYNDLNNEFLLSPRIGLSWKPANWTRDIIFRGAAGAYHQPPFYRELRRPDGSINKDLKAQRSYQVTAGFDYNFRRGSKPYRLTTEAYYKTMQRIVPYDLDNVRLRYSGNNEAKAFATGVEMRLFTELVKDAESWISLGFMRTRENLDNDVYYDYKLDSSNNVVDSTLQQGGWFRRPTDRLFTFGLFLQDYLATNKNFKVYLNFLYGSNLPYNIPGSIKYRNALTIDPYIRIDIGFSALLLDADKANRRSHNPFRNFENIWATFEVFNLIDRDNTISYMLIKDFSNTRFALPNRLTPRLLNLKVVARF